MLHKGDVLLRKEDFEINFSLMYLVLLCSNDMNVTFVTNKLELLLNSMMSCSSNAVSFSFFFFFSNFINREKKTIMK